MLSAAGLVIGIGRLSRGRSAGAPWPGLPAGTIAGVGGSGGPPLGAPDPRCARPSTREPGREQLEFSAFRLHSLVARRAGGAALVAAVSLLTWGPAAAQTPVLCGEVSLRTAIDGASTGAILLLPDGCTITLTGASGEEVRPP